MASTFSVDNFLGEMHLASKDLIRLWNGLDGKAVSSIAVIITILILRWVIVAWLYNSQDVPAHVRNQWKHRIRYITLFFILAILLVVWAPEIRTFAVSIVAFAVALVIAFRTRRTLV